MFPKERRAQQERALKFASLVESRDKFTIIGMLVLLGIFFIAECSTCDGMKPHEDPVGPLLMVIFGWPFALCGCSWLLFQIHDAAATSPAPEPKPAPHGNAHWATVEELHKHGALGEPVDDGLFLGLDDDSEQPLRYQGEKSIITIGPAGSGKLASVIGYNLALYPGSVIVNDPKGEAAAISAQHRRKFGKVFVLNPFGVLLDECPFMRSSGFNPLAELDPASESFSGDCTMLGDAVIVPEKQAYFTDSARNLVAGIIGYACLQPGEVRNLARVNEILNLPEPAFRAVMQLMADSSEDFIKHAARPFLDSKEAKSLPDVLATARTQLGTFLNTKGIQRVLSGNDFTWADLKAATVSVFIVLPEDKSKAFSRFTRLVYASSLRALLRFPAKPVYYVMDELATSLGDAQLGMVETAFNLGRGFGVRIHAFFQNWAQVKTVFGDKATSLESGAGLVQYFQPAEEDTYKKMQSRAGTWTDWVPTTSTNRGASNSTGGGHGGNKSSSESYGTSTGEQAFKRDLIDPEIAYEKMGKLTEASGYTAHQVLFFEGLASPAWSTRKGYWIEPRIAGMLAPNPYKKS